MQQILNQLALVPPAVWGILSALSFGGADFIARFTSRRFGHHASLFITIAVGIVLFLPVFFSQGGLARQSPTALMLIATYGVLFTVSMLLLYQVLARGPINVVAPIVAAHPLFIVLVAYAFGSRLSIEQWLAILALLLCVVIIVACVRERTDRGGGDSKFLRDTIGLSLLTSVAYAANVFISQRAVAIVGEVSTLWLGHLVAAGTLLLIAWRKLRYPAVTPGWWGILLAQGVLNVSGVLFLFAGSLGAFPEITALLSSEFSVVTILLAALFLRERMTLLQTAAVAGVFVSTAYLSIT